MYGKLVDRFPLEPLELSCPNGAVIHITMGDNGWFAGYIAAVGGRPLRRGRRPHRLRPECQGRSASALQPSSRRSARYGRKKDAIGRDRMAGRWCVRVSFAVTDAANRLIPQWRKTRPVSQWSIFSKSELTNSNRRCP
jgi:hypothetical protein